MKVAIIGSGSWGTALAQVLADNKQDVMVWGRNLDELVDIQVHHQNEKYFPGVFIHERIQASMDIHALLDAEVFLLAIPSEAIEDVCETLNEVWTILSSSSMSLKVFILRHIKDCPFLSKRKSDLRS